jgi:hypothetical protein
MKLADVFPRVLNRAWNHRQAHKPEAPLQFPHDFACGVVLGRYSVPARFRTKFVHTAGKPSTSYW